nr:YdcF family protein [Candidatus Glomeribacter gigasporarum]
MSAAATLNITVSSEAEVCGGILRGLGVAASELLLETKSMNTYQNAQFSRALLEQLHPDRIALVTSGFHIRRSLLYFAHFGIDASGIRADFLRPFRSLFPISYNFTVTDLALKEYLGVARYHLYNALGWNIRAVRPGAL